MKLVLSMLRFSVFSNEGDFFQKENIIKDLEQYAHYFKLARATLYLKNNYTDQAFRLMDEVSEKHRELDKSDLFVSEFKEKCLIEEYKKYKFCKS